MGGLFQNDNDLELNKIAAGAGLIARPQKRLLTFAELTTLSFAFRLGKVFPSMRANHYSLLHIILEQDRSSLSSFGSEKSK